MFDWSKVSHDVKHFMLLLYFNTACVQLSHQSTWLSLAGRTLAVDEHWNISTIDKTSDQATSSYQWYELLSPFPIFVQCKTRLGKDLYCVEWDVNPYSTQLNMCNVILQCFTAQCYAVRSIATASRQSACMSIMLRYHDHIGWKSLKIIWRRERSGFSSDFRQPVLFGPEIGPVHWQSRAPV